MELKKFRKAIVIKHLTFFAKHVGNYLLKEDLKDIFCSGTFSRKEKFDVSKANRRFC